MKKGIYAWLLSITFLLPVFGMAQYVVQKSSTALNTTADGFYYSLPKTVLRIQVSYESVQKIKGPLADYTQRYLGTDDFIAKNSEYTRIIDVQVEPVTMADPGETFWVQFPASEKSKEPVKETFTLSKLGTLLAFDDVDMRSINNFKTEKEVQLLHPGETAHFPMDAGYNRKKEVDTVIRKITVDTVTIRRFLFKSSWTDRTEEEKADDAAKQIAKIREARYNLITGFQEVNYGGSIRYMDGQLQKLERQYLELFLGKELLSLHSETVTFDPDKGKLTKNILSFTDEQGNYRQLKIKVVPQPLPEGVQERPQQKVDNLFYRIPVTAQVKVVSENQTYFNKYFTIPQLGGIGSVPIGKNKLQFDVVTGTLVKIKRMNSY